MAQEEVSRSRELLKEALQSYEGKARALLLLPNGTQPARVRCVLLVFLSLQYAITVKNLLYIAAKAGGLL